MKLGDTNKEISEVLYMWVSVKEELPPDFQEVLISTSSMLCVGCYNRDMQLWTTLDYESGVEETVEDVTHWMYIPEPTKVNADGA